MISEIFLFFLINCYIFSFCLLFYNVFLYKKNKQMWNHSFIDLLLIIMICFSFISIFILPFKKNNFAISQKNTYINSVIENDTSIIFISPYDHKLSFKLKDIDSLFLNNIKNSDGILWYNYESFVGLIVKNEILPLNNNQYNYYKNLGLKEHK